MGATKKLALEIRAEMSQETFEAIPHEIREEMKLKDVSYPNLKEEFKKDPEWQSRNKVLIEAIKSRREREDEIAVIVRNGG
jgi:hypothetical protein